MRILWMSNAPWARTGYGVQTRLFTTRLVAAGHQVAIQAFYGFEAGVMDWGGIRIYPKVYHPWGMDSIEANADDWRADLVITLLDVWVCEPKMIGAARWAPWFPIDHEPVPSRVVAPASKSFQPLVFSRFGEAMALDAGLDVRYVPHGVETQVFRPMDRNEARKALGWPADAFVTAMVAANKGTPSRKAWPQNVEGFARFWRRHRDALLYCHTTAGFYYEEEGVNLPKLMEYLGIGQAVRFCDQYQNTLGYPDEYLAQVYSAADVLLSVSMGEGFGIPILEAQSCGCPVIVGNWTSMPELCWGGYVIPKSESEPTWTQQEAYQFVPHIGAIEAALEMAYLESEGERAAMRERSRKGALAYDADLVMQEYWTPVLAEIEQRIADGQAQAASVAVEAMA